ncbi:MAG: O-antigen ligase family protein [Bacteroidia bacterium]|nr:O-antigen ligase family protein [Bacteroidia bacterium]
MWRINKSNRIGVALLVFLFVVLPILNVHSAIDPDLSPRIIAVSAFCAIGLLIFSRNPIEIPATFRKLGILSIGIVLISFLALFSSINPGDALAEWLRIFVIYSFTFISVIILSRSKLLLFTILRFISVGILVFSVFAIIQTIPIIKDLINHKKFSISSDLASTLSNKNFFSEVLVLLMPFSFFAMVSDERRFKLLHFVAFILATFYIFLLTSLACWMAIAVALLVVGITVLFGGSQKTAAGKKSSLARIVVGALLIISTGIFTVLKLPISQSLKFKVEMMSKYLSDPTLLDQNVKTNNNSIFDRILMIRNSLKMIADHPLTGVGLNNWKLLYTTYGVGGTEVINSGAMNFEHPHNDYLLIFSEQGIFGLILYLLFFLFVFKIWNTKWKNSGMNEHSFLLVILFSIVAFLVISLFSYPRSRIYSPVILMFIIALLFRNESDTDKKLSINAMLTIIAAIICLASVIVTTIRLNSEIHAKKMMIAKIQKNFARVIRESEKIDPFFYPIEINSTSIDWYRGMALFYSGQILPALNEYQKAVLRTPYHIRTLNDLATAYEQTGQPDSAIVYYKKALAISPELTDARLNLSATYFNQNQIDSAYQTINYLSGSSVNANYKESYLKFMTAILSAKIMDSVNAGKDTLLFNKMSTFVNDVPRLKKYIRNYSGKTIWPDVFKEVN